MPKPNTVAISTSQNRFTFASPHANCLGIGVPAFVAVEWPPTLLDVSVLSLQYRDAILRADLDAYRAGGTDPALLLYQAGDLAIDYAPFDHIEANAELVIAGLTPGRTQAANAIQAMAAALRAGAAHDEALLRTKNSASFSGPIRRNLLALLDAIGVPALYGRTCAAEFFEQGSRVHFTSVLRYPVYLRGRNYSGSPDILRHPLLRNLINRYLAEEAELLLHALWVPLGGNAERALLYLAQEGRLDHARILAGLPHPSGANAERIAYFLRRKPRESLSERTNAESLDAKRSRLKMQIARLRDAA
jgi:hypothetical protein